MGDGVDVVARAQAVGVYRRSGLHGARSCQCIVRARVRHRCVANPLEQNPTVQAVAEGSFLHPSSQVVFVGWAVALDVNQRW